VNPMEACSLGATERRLSARALFATSLSLGSYFCGGSILTKLYFALN